MNDNILSGRV